MSQNRSTSRAPEPDPSTKLTKLPGSTIKLQTLAPEYKEEQHATYVRHLTDAVDEPKNKNIALTGRYGSGKSSILDEFLSEQEGEGKRILRISINTLGPDDDEDLTNRIQKELVKQLVYRTNPGEIRRSRFARRNELTRWRALGEASLIGGVIVGLLWLFGIRPDPDALGTDHLLLPTLAFLLLLVVPAWAVRWFVGNRPISQFSTGGTSISFEKQPDSYFDEYLDEIVAFFDATEPDLVVFEDLDRFDDPQIFDSLRELNTLINASAQWKDGDRPLRFIYAIKDSLFEKLGEGPGSNDQEKNETRDQDRPTEASGVGAVKPSSAVVARSEDRRDAAEAAVERANRTKFFEIVIPVVPFISHSNARDLLSEALDKLRLPEGNAIDRALLDLVARHATDMRLLINICNEFVVFAERILWVETPTPGMEASDLFALVAYKNFHLADFEALPQRGSVLDVLEKKRRELVRHSIEELQSRKRELQRVSDLEEKQSEIAGLLGDRLEVVLSRTPGGLLRLEVEDTTEEPSAIHRVAFWRRVFEAGALTAVSRVSSMKERSVSFDRDQLATLFSEGRHAHQWCESDADELAAQRAKIDEEVAALRGADFSDLARDRRYFLDGMTFDDQLESVLESELARDLVRGGFIDRYYAEYSAVFYGKFIGVDVANFFRNSVWPNEMNVDFKFTTPDAVRNLLDHAPTGFTNSRSAFNIHVVDHMLEHRPELANEVAAFFVAEQNEDAFTFLDAFLNDVSSRKVELIGLLASQPWRGLLNHLALEDSVPDEDARTMLLDVTLLSASDADSYDLGEQASELLIDRHAQLSAFANNHGADRAAIVLSFVRRARLVVPSLEALSSELCTLVVDDRAYVLTADNLRAALNLGEDEPITLDQIRQNEAVWHRCKEAIGTYFDALDHDDRTEHAVQAAETLGAVISGQHGDWSDEQIARLLESSAPEAALLDVAQVPREVWPAVAASRRMVPSVANLHTYSAALGVDENLAKVLLTEQEVPVELEGVEDAEFDVIHDLIVRILNASRVFAPSVRVRLTLQLVPDPRPDIVDVAEVQPSADDLLAELLRAGLLPDTAATFEHFLTAGWCSVSEAFKVSKAAQKFLTPELVAGHVLTMLRDPAVPTAVKSMVLDDLGSYSANEDSDVLREAASFAHASKTRLTLPQLERVAPHVSDPEHVLWQLAQMGKDLDGNDAIRVLALLGDEYKGFGGEPGDEFDLPITESIRTVLDRLRTNELVALPRGGKVGRKKVQLG